MIFFSSSYLRRCSISVNNIHVDPVVDELIEEFLSSLFALHEYQDWWCYALR